MTGNVQVTLNERIYYLLLWRVFHMEISPPTPDYSQFLWGRGLTQQRMHQYGITSSACPIRSIPHRPIPSYQMLQRQPHIIELSKTPHNKGDEAPQSLLKPNTGICSIQWYRGSPHFWKTQRVRNLHKMNLRQGPLQSGQKHINTNYTTKITTPIWCHHGECWTVYNVNYRLSLE